MSLPPLGILQGKTQEDSTIKIYHQPLPAGHPGHPCPATSPSRPHSRSLQALDHQALVEPEGRSSGLGVSPLLLAPLQPGCFSPLPISSSPRTQTHTGLRWGWQGRGAPPPPTRPHRPSWTSSGARLARVSWVWDGGGEWGADSDATRGLGPPTPTPPGPRSILAAQASLPGRTAGAGRGARRLPREVGRPPGSLARIKYLLCFVWPLGEGREGCRIDPELPAGRGGAGPGGGGWAHTRRPAPQPPWAGRVGTPGPPSTPPPVDPSRGGDLLPSRWAAVTDLGYREGAAGRPGNASHPEDA